jgi:AraC family transcriptional regulator
LNAPFEENDMTTSLQYQEATALTWTVPVETFDFTAPRRGLSRRVLLRACTHIERHLGDCVTLSDLANVAGVSRFHFARLFRMSTGYSPMAFLLRKRIERAKALLDRGNMPICEIAAMLGFSDQSHFSRTFRKLEGVTPKQFARACAERVGV